MRKGFFRKLFFTCCIFLGCMAGYGIVQVTGTGGGTIYNIITKTKDNTLDEEKDSVFFVSNGEHIDVTIMPEKQLQENNSILENITNESFVQEELKKEELEVTITINPTITPKIIEETKEIEEKETIGQTLLITPIEVQDSELEKSLEAKKEDVEQNQEIVIEETEVSQSIVEDIEQEENKININEILARGIKEKIENPSKETEKKEKEMKESDIVIENRKEDSKVVEVKENETMESNIGEHQKITKNEKENTNIVEEVKKQNTVIENSAIMESEQVFTYPTEIFGQTPIVNRSDEYVTYFEFAIDLIETVEQEVKAKGLSETALFAKFVVKALFCGVDVKTIKINEPISRSEAALALWLTAQVMEEKGTSITEGASYITDLGNCSSSEKKAIAYLYEQGVISGYQIAGQTFLPSKDLRTKDSETWIAKIKQCWK